MQETPEDQKNREVAHKKLSTNGRKFFKFIEFDSNEQLITEIRKHPIGLIFILLIGIFVAVAVLGVAAVASAVNLNELVGINNLNGLKGLLILVAFFTVIGVIVMTFIAVFLYVNNVIYVTSEKIAQVLYTSLFHRKISQLSIGDVQDVTVTQKGILAHIFNYGTLVIETAGEQQNYTFSFIPDPYQSAKLIVGAHERNLTTYGN